MNHFIPSLYLEADPADIIVATSAGTYIGKFDRSQFNPALPAEGQKIWSIRFIEATDESTTKTLYPNGVQLFAFVWDDREDYTYKYAF